MKACDESRDYLELENNDGERSELVLSWNNFQTGVQGQDGHSAGLVGPPPPPPP